jgi:hypothetical protein
MNVEVTRLSPYRSVVKRIFNRRRTEVLWCYVFILPFLLFFGSFTIWPLVGTMIFSLSHVNGIGRIDHFIGLDVYDEEPLSPDSPLRGLENVFLAPHLAGPTPDRYEICAEHALANIRAYRLNQPLESLVGGKEYDRMT